MKLGDIYDALDQISPFELQESWDNSGLLVGKRSDEVQKIILSIDLDRELLEQVEPNVCFVVHHPLIFSGIKQLDFDAYPSNLLQIMIQKNISLIAMHTNFDKTHLNAYVMQNVLGLEIEEKVGFIYYAKVDSTFEDLCKKVKKDFALEQLKVVETSAYINRIALCTGSGASLIPEVQANCLLTGDIKYHDAMGAKTTNLGLIDIGHYESERFFAEILHAQLTEMQITVIISSSKNPFMYKS